MWSTFCLASLGCFKDKGVVYEVKGELYIVNCKGFWRGVRL
jgi:hypothetical protein